jgi:hypothetical protein
MHRNTAPVSDDLSRIICPRKSPSPVNTRGGDWDCVRQMQIYRHRPDVLAKALLDMGVTESGDEALADGHQN